MTKKYKKDLTINKSLNFPTNFIFNNIFFFMIKVNILILNN